MITHCYTAVTTLVIVSAFLSICPASAATIAVTVPSTANGSFGQPNQGGYGALVAAATLKKAGNIFIQYKSGTVTLGGGAPPTDANGESGAETSVDQTPLQEASGEIDTPITNAGALFGVFVPSYITSQAKFLPVDNSKGISALGIEPRRLFFIGKYGSWFEAPSAGILYLGVNDGNPSNNAGSFIVDITTP